MVRNLFGFPKRLYREARKQFRVKERLPIKWRINNEIFGIGKVRDISASGALIEASALRPIGDGTVLQIEADSPAQGKFLPSQGRITWSRKKSFFSENLLCGVEFINPVSEVVERLKERVQDRIAKIERFEKIGDVLNVILFLTAVILGVIVLRQQSGIQRTIERSNHLMLGSSKQQASLYQEFLARHDIQLLVFAELNKEYNTTKALLTQTENLLAQSHEQNKIARNEISSLKSSLVEAQAVGIDDSKTKILIAERAGLRQNLVSLKSEINALIENNPRLFGSQAASYQNRIQNLNLQVKDLKYSTLMASISDHKQSMIQARKRIRDLKRQAAVARQEVQYQKDQIGLLKGNRGYLTKGGQVFAGGSDSGLSENGSQASKSTRKVNIDVSLFE